jgi:hypothetical protein
MTTADGNGDGNPCRQPHDCTHNGHAPLFAVFAVAIPHSAHHSDPYEAALDSPSCQTTFR